ncbi:MAG: helix-turn-helix transcriptional regulator [Mesorhizobium sp.]|nr:helix-turn-helix transcriptional regulator [Mesorhizobium sp.]
MMLDRRSGCPINLSLEVFGDRWSLVILRDMIFGGRRHFRELLTHSMEGIASNILADRLRRLLELGKMTRADDPSHKQKAIYSLTEMSIQLVPIMAALGAWGRAWLPVSEELSIRAELMEKGGPALWERFMDELRFEHLGIGVASPEGETVRAELRAAYAAVVARKAVPPIPFEQERL